MLLSKLDRTKSEFVTYTFLSKPIFCNFTTLRIFKLATCFNTEIAKVGAKVIINLDNSHKGYFSSSTNKSSTKNLKSVRQRAVR